MLNPVLNSVYIIFIKTLSWFSSRFFKFYSSFIQFVLWISIFLKKNLLFKIFLTNIVNTDQEGNFCFKCFKNLPRNFFFWDILVWKTWQVDPCIKMKHIVFVIFLQICLKMFDHFVTHSFCTALVVLEPLS